MLLAGLLLISSGLFWCWRANIAASDPLFRYLHPYMMDLSEFRNLALCLYQIFSEVKNNNGQSASYQLYTNHQSLLEIYHLQIVSCMIDIHFHEFVSLARNLWNISWYTLHFIQGKFLYILPNGPWIMCAFIISYSDPFSV